MCDFLYITDNENVWEIHISPCIVVSSVLLDEYTTLYACYWSFSYKNPIHLYTFFHGFKSCIGFVLSVYVNASYQEE